MLMPEPLCMLMPEPLWHAAKDIKLNYSGVIYYRVQT